MNWKIILFWTVLFGGLSFFFFSFASYLFARQEEAQLFMLEWNSIRDVLLRPGRCCRIAGQIATLYFHNALFASLLHASLLTVIGYCTWRLLQSIAPRSYNWLLALIPVAALFKFHIQWGYIVDGTFALLLMMVFLLTFTLIRKKKIRAVYAFASTLLLYGLAGQIVLPYTLLLIAIGLMGGEKPAVYHLLVVLAGAALVYVDIRYAKAIPLTDGRYILAYHEAQIQPYSFVYYVWLRVCLLILVLFATAWLMSLIRWEGKWKKASIITVVAIACSLFAYTRLPDRLDVQSRTIDQLSYHASRHNWDAIINLCYGKKIPGTITRNYLNMALAQKGVLGNRLFYFDQHGPLGLLAPYNNSFSMTLLLGDIHFLIGDISTSESYNMEALTIARRGGSPRVLQRLIQISLLRGEWKVAEKYLDILDRMPHYRIWSAHYRTLLRNPGAIAAEPELAGKQPAPATADNLLGLLDISTLWEMHLDEPAPNRTAVEYLGCSYLLAKETDRFKALLLRIANDPQWSPLPVHFQEAALLLMEQDTELAAAVRIDEPIRKRFNEYMQACRQALMSSNGPVSLYPAYGNTFWFYYQFIELTKK